MIYSMGQPLFTGSGVKCLDMGSIGDRVKIARLAMGWNQPELARETHISKQAISQIETGTTKNPTPENLLKIADATGFELRWLISGEGPQTRKDAALDKLDISELSSDSKAAIRAVMDSFKKQTHHKTNHN